MALSEEAAYFKEICQDAELVRLTRQNPGTACLGGYAAVSGFFDPKLDRAYHLANPTAPVCVNGRVGAGVTTEDVRAFVSDGLGERERERLSLGVFGVGDKLLLCPADVTLTTHPEEGITSFVTLAEFPISSGDTYRIVSPDRVFFLGDPLYSYAKLEQVGTE